MSSIWCYDLGEVSMPYNAAARHNNGMQPTADTLAVINSRIVGRRVMPGVRCSMFRGVRKYESL